MTTKGKITHWNDKKGYGFITPDAGAKEVFVRISAFRDRDAPPEVGQLVSFSHSTGRRGRPCAANVTRPGERMPGEIRRNDVML